MNCQLAAYIGDRPIAELLLNALEYQQALYGGHATGMGVLNGDRIDIVKAAGPVSHVKETHPEITGLKGTCAIAHSRYSDNARVNPDYNLDEMAHPYISDDGRLALMHNGGIANYKELWSELEKEHTFRSYGEVVDDITDSEVAVHKDDRSELEVKSDTPTALLSSFRAVLSQREPAPFTPRARAQNVNLKN